MSGVKTVMYVVAAFCVIEGLVLLNAALRPIVRPDPATQSKNPNVRKMRIVSLSPGVTEMLFLLGVGDSVVGATDFCDYPPEAKKIERVGGLGKPSLEKLLTLSPDLIIASGLERNDVLQILSQSGVRVIKTKIESIDDMFDTMRQIGCAVGKAKRADEVIASMQAELKSVAAQSNDARRGPPPTVFVELWDDPLTTVGRNSFIDDVISRAGGVNVAHDLPQAYVRITPEKVIVANPDMIVIAHMKRSPASPTEVGDRIGWSDVKAVKQGKVFSDVSTDLLLRPGPRLIEAVKILSKHLSEVTPADNSKQEAGRDNRSAIPSKATP